ncbi:hypothetical protein [Azospirillum argentinense]
MSEAKAGCLAGKVALMFGAGVFGAGVFGAGSSAPG